MPNKRQAGTLPNQCYFPSQSQTNCLFICFFQMKGVLLCNTYSREICLLIKMLQIVFSSLCRPSILSIGNGAGIDQDEGKLKDVPSRKKRKKGSM